VLRAAARRPRPGAEPRGGFAPVAVLRLLVGLPGTAAVAAGGHCLGQGDVAVADVVKGVAALGPGDGLTGERDRLVVLAADSVRTEEVIN